MCIVYSRESFKSELWVLVWLKVSSLIDCCSIFLTLGKSCQSLTRPVLAEWVSGLTMEALKCFQPSTSGIDLNRAGHKNKQPSFSQIFCHSRVKAPNSFGWVIDGGVITFNYLEPKNLFGSILHKIVHLWLFILKIYGDLEWLEFEAIVLWLLFSFPRHQVRDMQANKKYN